MASVDPIRSKSSAGAMRRTDLSARFFYDYFLSSSASKCSYCPTNSMSETDGVFALLINFSFLGMSQTILQMLSMFGVKIAPDDEDTLQRTNSLTVPNYIPHRRHPDRRVLTPRTHATTL